MLVFFIVSFFFLTLKVTKIIQVFRLIASFISFENFFSKKLSDVSILILINIRKARIKTALILNQISLHLPKLNPKCHKSC